MEVGYYSDVDETDYVRIEGSNSSMPYHLGEFTGTIKYKNGNQYIATNENGSFIKFTYNGDSIDVTDNGGLFGFVGNKKASQAKLRCFFCYEVFFLFSWQVLQ